MTNKNVNGTGHDDNTKDFISNADYEKFGEKSHSKTKTDKKDYVGTARENIYDS